MPTMDFVVGGAGSRCLLRINNYWDDNEMALGGEWMNTPSFNAGDCYWRIYCKLHGGCTSTSCADHMPIFIVLDGRVAKPIKAHARFSLLDQAGDPVPGHSACIDIREYSQVGDTYGCDVPIPSLQASRHLLPDGFTIACDISMYRASPLSSELQQHLLHTDADVVFYVGGETFSAHRRVLAARSPVLEAVLSRGTTSGASCIRVDDMLPHVFKSLLYFVYTDSLPGVTGADKSMMTEQLLAAADRFDLLELKLICEEKLIRELNENTVAKILKLAVQHHSIFLREACIEMLQDPPVLEAAMAMDGDLLEQVAKTCPALLKKMWAYEDDPMLDELVMCL